jgi:hypothetical protein
MAYCPKMIQDAFSKRPIFIVSKRKSRKPKRYPDEKGKFL